MGGPLNGFNPDPVPAVWLCSSVDVTATDTPDWVTAAEAGRLARLSGEPRADFLTSRWLIRHALAAASGCEARHCSPADARPRTSDQPPGWQLSISHSGGVAGCAVSAGTAIGLDIEPITRRPSWQKVVKRWFSPQERAWLLAADDPEAFLRVWTLKEAWLKATGRGIADNLKTLTVTAETELTGDRPHEPWRASLGRSGDHLVAVVYQSQQTPRGTGIYGQINLGDLNNLDTGHLGVQPVEWILHRQIHSL